MNSWVHYKLLSKVSCERKSMWKKLLKQSLPSNMRNILQNMVTLKVDVDIFEEESADEVAVMLEKIHMKKRDAITINVVVVDVKA